MLERSDRVFARWSGRRGCWHATTIARRLAGDVREEITSRGESSLASERASPASLAFDAFLATRFDANERLGAIEPGAAPIATTRAPPKWR